MSRLEEYKIGYALEKTNRAMSVLRLIESALQDEIDFQDQFVDRPVVPAIRAPAGLGEILDAVSVCREVLDDCWETLKREGFTS